MSTYHWKNHSMDFITGHLLLVDKKDYNNNMILVIVNELIRIVYYEPVKTTIDVVS